MPPPITNTSDVVDDAPAPFALLSALAAGDVVAEREATAKTAADAPDMPEKRRLSMLGECTQHDAGVSPFRKVEPSPGPGPAGWVLDPGRPGF